jgi:FHS family L-fucose permease-like MFS transporter
MMIMGGGFISVLQGALADDNLLGIQQSYWLGVVCFAYLVFFAWSVSKILRNRGVDIFATEKVSGH